MKLKKKKKNRKQQKEKPEQIPHENLLRSHDNHIIKHQKDKSSKDLLYVMYTLIDEIQAEHLLRY